MSKVEIRDFEFLNKLGSGAFGTVELVRKKNESNGYAMKTIFKKDCVSYKDLSRVMIEKFALFTFRNIDFITKMYYAFESHIGFHLVMKFYPGGSVNDYLEHVGCLSGRELQVFMAEVFIGLNYLHEEDFIHRDLKPDNLLIDTGGHVVIADFGSASEMDPSSKKASGTTGTPCFQAPETLIGEFDMRADLWSLGVLGHMTATCRGVFCLPVKGGCEAEIAFILSHEPSINPSLPKDLYDLISSLVVVCPENRISKTNIFGHRYFNPLDWNSVINRTSYPPFPKQYVQNRMNKLHYNMKSSKDVFEEFYYDFNVDESAE